jgi:metal-responsive CopG/Arc/MetJ family transcriptional regulator
VAKVLISLPDELLGRIDAQTARAGESRSGFFQRLAERELDREHMRWRQEIEELMTEVLATEADKPRTLPHVPAAQLIREDRESH